MISLLLPLILAIFTTPKDIVMAATSTPTQDAQEESSPSPASDPSQDIQKIREAVQQKVKEKLASITSTNTGNKGFIGNITDINDSNLTINYQGQDFKLLVDQDTVFVDTDRNKTSLDKISTGQAVLAMGYFNKSQVLETKRLIIIESESLTKTKHIIVGKIVDISQSSSIFVLIPNDDKDVQYQVKTDSKTKTLNRDKTTLKYDQLENGHKVIVILSATIDNSKTYYAHKIIKLNEEKSSSAGLPDPTPTETSSEEAKEDN